MTRVSAIIFILITAVIGWHSCGSKKEEKNPNIIILYADDMGYGDLACQNPSSKIPTPNLDRLAANGMRFTDGHSSSGICTPSRYALLTGRYHWRDFHGIVGPMGGPVFSKNQYTLATMLKENGYATGCVGKWHLGWDWDSIRIASWTKQDTMTLFGRTKHFFPPEAYDWSRPVSGGPLDRGFDYYYGDGTINFPPYTWMENDRIIDVPTQTMRHPKGLALEGNWEARPGPAVENWDFFDVLPTLIEKAVAFVKRQKKADKPFFLYVPFNSPHAPIVPHKDFQGKSGAGGYGDFVFQTDWGVGQILEALDEIGATENTLVIFTADNGPERYAYDRIRNFDHQSFWPFRGLKRDVYEGGHHVPFLVRWPGKIESGTTSDQVIHQADLLKTIASIIGTDLPKGLAHDSHDFSKVWLDGQVPEVRTFTVHNTFEKKYALRQGDWLFINQPDGYHSRTPDWIPAYFGYEESQDSAQLFNLKDDIGQKENLVNAYPEKVAEMKVNLSKVRENFTFVEE